MTVDPPGGGRRRSILLDAAVAIALAVILTIGWATTDWPRLSRLLLPDPDDMMRLAQVRDWIAGQGTNDWTQYRMAPPAGSPMHWSRVNDIGIAAIILALTPLVGQAGAELAAVLVYPALLFACAMFLSARIARRLWGDSAGPVAAVLTALAYPGTTVFIPGRIDHHALQVVLIQLLVLALMHRAGWRAGVAAGCAAALSLLVGLETAPQVGTLVMAITLLWVADGARERARLAGFGAALGLVTLLFLALFRPGVWTAALCDAFTPAAATAMLAGAAELGLLAWATSRLERPIMRCVAAAVVGGIALGGTLVLFPSCISGPYGEMDPFLIKAFLPYIDEANGIFQQRAAKILAIGGLLIVATFTALWLAWRERRRWRVMMPVLAVVVMSGLVMLVQVRGVYIGAPLAAPVMAALVIAARERSRGRVPAVIAAWLAGAGMAYATLADQAERHWQPHGTVRSDADAGSANGSAKPQVLCSVGDAWAQVDRLPPGVIATGTNVAAYVVGATRHSTLGAGYHRANTGNMAMYRFFLGDPASARVIAERWRVSYVLFCPGDFDEIQVDRNFPASMAAALRARRAPDWLEPIALHGTPMRLYRVRRVASGPT